MDYAKLTVEELRIKYCEITGESVEVAESIKGKKNIIDKILEYQKAVSMNVDLGELDLGEHFAVANEAGVETDKACGLTGAPQIGQAGWQDYVLSLFAKDEMENKDGKKHPRANGLRRVAQQLLGPIIKSGPTQVFPPTGPKNQATVVYEIVFDWQANDMGGKWLTEGALLSREIRTFTEVADSTSDNTPYPYNLHPSATAASRAEGRALRKALQLNVQTAEEMQTMSPADRGNGIISLPATDENAPIKSIQKILINNLTTKMNINVVEALKFHGMGADVDALSYNQATEFLTALNKYQTSKDLDTKVPEILKNV